MMRSRLWLIAVCATLSLLVAAGVILCEAAIRVSRRPVPALPPSIANAGVKAVSVLSFDGLALKGWLLTPQGLPGSRCVLALHGIGDNRGGMLGFAPLLLDRGYQVLLPDSRGHGESEGGHVTYGVLEKRDVVSWAEVLRGHGCETLVGIGESLGAAVLLQSMSAVPFHAIVAECAFLDLEEIGAYRVRQMTGFPLPRALVWSAMAYARVRYGWNLWQASPRRAMAGSHARLLLIHGMGDVNTPPWHSSELRRASGRADLWLVPRAAHTNASGVAAEEFWRRVWLTFEN
jgi:hypothetical protein